MFFILFGPTSPIFSPQKRHPPVTRSSPSWSLPRWRWDCHRGRHPSSCSSSEPRPGWNRPRFHRPLGKPPKADPVWRLPINGLVLFGKSSPETMVLTIKYRGVLYIFPSILWTKKQDRNMNIDGDRNDLHVDPSRNGELSYGDILELILPARKNSTLASKRLKPHVGKTWNSCQQSGDKQNCRPKIIGSKYKWFWVQCFVGHVDPLWTAHFHCTWTSYCLDPLGIPLGVYLEDGYPQQDLHAFRNKHRLWLYMGIPKIHAWYFHRKIPFSKWRIWYGVPPWRNGNITTTGHPGRRRAVGRRRCGSGIGPGGGSAPERPSKPSPGVEPGQH